MNIGKTIKELRKHKGWTQSELGGKIGVDQKVITSYERNIAKPPLERIAILARIFEVSTDMLLGLDSQMPDTSKPTFSKRTTKMIDQFEKLPVSQQRALLQMVEASVEKNTK